MTCKICASDELRKLYFLQGHQIWQCTRCGFGQVEISPAELAAFYDQAYFQGDKARFGQTAEQDILPSHAYWLDHQIRLAPRPEGGRPMTVLDIGPGLSGGFGKHIRAHHPGFVYEAVEISDFAAESLRGQGFTIHHGRCVDKEILAACAGRFDLVVGTEVIEHDPEPHAFIAAVRTMLKPGGRCAFTTGNLRGWMARSKKDAWYYLDPPAHVSYYTPEAARILFETEKMERVKNWRVGFNHLRLKLKYGLPGMLGMVHALHLSTGMTMSAYRPKGS